MLPKELENIMDFAEEVEEDVMPIIRRDAKEKKRNLTIADCKLSRKDFVKALRKGISISIWHDIKDTYGIFMMGVRDIRLFSILEFISFTNFLLLKFLDGINFIIFCWMCILLSPIITSSFRSRLQYEFEDWTLDMIIRDAS